MAVKELCGTCVFSRAVAKDFDFVSIVFKALFLCYHVGLQLLLYIGWNP